MIESYGISLEQMMENAGRNLAELARQLLGAQVRDRQVTVLCGPGNNGGGGMVAARHLHNWGAQVKVVRASDPSRLKDVPAHQWSILRAMQLDQADFVDLESSALILDALLGYSATGDPRSPLSRVNSRTTFLAFTKASRAQNLRNALDSKPAALTLRFCKPRRSPTSRQKTRICASPPTMAVSMAQRLYSWQLARATASWAC